MARVIAYVDGYNLYHRRLDGTPYKWLNLRLLAEYLMPNDTVLGVRYFTTRAQPRDGDQQQPERQQAYLRALETLGPSYSVEFGLFRERKKRLKRVDPPNDWVWVFKTEEKGSDVNLASRLLLDGFRNEFDTALVISNDADLKAPINLVRAEFSKTVVVAIPGTAKQIKKSALPADRFERILKDCLKACQFPDQLQDSVGTITKPASW